MFMSACTIHIFGYPTLVFFSSRLSDLNCVLNTKLSSLLDLKEYPNHVLISWGPVLETIQKLPRKTKCGVALLIMIMESCFFRSNKNQSSGGKTVFLQSLSHFIFAHEYLILYIINLFIYLFARLNYLINFERKNMVEVFLEFAFDMHY